MKIKTSETTPLQLDWLVESIEIALMKAAGETIKTWWVEEKQTSPSPYSSDWLWGGPIIDREMMQRGMALDSDTTHVYAEYRYSAEQKRYSGPTPLIAAMRCYVASKLGDEVEVPEEVTPDLPGFVVYIQDQDDHELWERADELPEVYPTRIAALAAIIDFSKRAADAGFSYPETDFKIVEKFIPTEETPDGNGTDEGTSEGSAESRQKRD